MANTLKFGTDGNWATKEGSVLGYNSENGNYKPLPFNFERAGSATRVNKQGLIEVVGNNEPRIDFTDDSKGALLLEPSRSNDLQRSQELDNAYWTKYQTSVSANSSISPDGTLNADKLIEDNSNSTHQLGKAISYNSGTTYTVSLFAKSSNRNLEIAAGNTNTFPVKAIFDLSNGTVLSSTLGSSSIENYGNGWYRCIITATALATATTNINFGLTNGSTLSYSGDGVSFIQLFGAMREQGSYATSYIPTSGSIGTRSAEVCNGAGNEQVFNDSEGVLMAEISALDESGGNREITLSDGTTSNRIIIQYRDSSNIRIILAKSTGDEFDTGVLPFNTIEANKIAVKYKINDFAFWVNGVEIYSDNTGNTFSSNTLSTINFDGGSGLNDFYGNVKQLQYFDKALTDQELIALTSN